jgi:hypothetical protein
MRRSSLYFEFWRLLIGRGSRGFRAGGVPERRALYAAILACQMHTTTGLVCYFFISIFNGLCHISAPPGTDAVSIFP